MKSTCTLKTSTFLLAILCVVSPLMDATDCFGSKPNILIILADDFGWGDASCNNPDFKVQTPAIDRIAKEGIRFTNAHTPSSVCSPTRYGLLTGRYPWRTRLKQGGMNGYVPALISKGRTTIASYLKSQGYRTGGFGKWHLGVGWPLKEGGSIGWDVNWLHDIGRAKQRGYPKSIGQTIDLSKPLQDSPVDHGFDTYFGTVSNGTTFPHYIQNNRMLVDFPRPARSQVDDLYVAKAIEFIENHEKDHQDSPFFVYLPLNAIHGAVTAPNRFKDKSQLSFREDKILWANESVGKMLAALDRMKLAEDTIVLFTADNGPINSPKARQKGHHAAGPYRGWKTNAWDGGTRVPFLARWPDKIPAGATTDHLIGLTDVLATIAEVCGAPLPGDAGPDSIKQLSVLLQNKDEIVARPALVTCSYAGFFAIRQGKWKAIFGTKWTGGHSAPNFGGLPPKGTPSDNPAIGQLYNLSSDPFETKDLWDDRPEVVETLRRELQAIRRKDKSDEIRWQPGRKANALTEETNP